ncbi:FG-GAP repeat domain-containing protein [Sphingobacterium sp. xlx-130]|uniref:FG-GAP repeat domain-containing protein n=1 Tax=Sphingobacterium sp. xlx-130 TaxID=2654323 RepID=UPI0013DD0B94|nr:VCBS repeat-containing protein [Sphingobacterium sp. xlx-130]
MKKLLIITGLSIFANFGLAQQFEKPVPLKLTNGELLIVESTHASPYIYDFNKDGLDDLLVGEFGNEPTKGGTTASYVKSKCRIYINKGSNEKPAYEDFFYLQADGEDAFVPVTCCIAFNPRIADLDGDGIDDLMTGDYNGNIYLFRGLGNQKFAAKEIIAKIENVYAICVEPIDWDNDGVLDLLVSSRGDNPRLVKNEGDDKQFKFAEPSLLQLEKCPYIYEPLKQNRTSNPVHVSPGDLDGDGLFDLVCSDESGNVFWFKNTGSITSPQFSEAIVIFDNNDYERIADNVEAVGNRPKVWVNDYNRDGKADILLGDIYGDKRKVRDLTPEEEMIKAKLDDRAAKAMENFDSLRKESSELLSKLSIDNTESYADRMKKMPKSFQKKLEDNQKEMSEVYGTLRKYDVYNYQDRGYVWLFTQK